MQGDKNVTVKIIEYDGHHPIKRVYVSQNPPQMLERLLDENQTATVMDCVTRLFDVLTEIRRNPNTHKATKTACGFAQIALQNAIEMLVSRPY